jgi:CheY-like chemotaxis protein
MSPSPDSKSAADGETLRVLIVDDEPTLRLGFAYALSNKMTTVETASNGRLAMERIEEARFDIMILDLRMPELDGIAVIQALRGKGNHMPIVLCSAALTPNAALCAIRHSVVDFLLKPVRPADLRQMIDFIRNPGRVPLALAMQAARNGRPGEAITILENEADHDRRSRYWLSLLKSIRDTQRDADASHLTEKVRTSLSTIAFNSLPVV